MTTQQPRIRWTRVEQHRLLNLAGDYYRLAVKEWEQGGRQSPTFCFQFGPAQARQLYWRQGVREALAAAAPYRVAASGLLP